MSTIKVTNLKHESSASDNITLDSSGRVGIGTASPVTTFVVDKSDASGLSAHILVNNSESSSGISLLGAGSTFSSAGWPSQTDCGIIRASAGSSNGLAIQAPTGSIAFWGGSSESARIDSSGNLRFNSGYGSVATAYGCRAWVNFNGTGTVAIRASGNVSSITDNGSNGDYNVNFTTAMPDANYATVYGFGINGTSTAVRLDGTYSTTAVHIQATNSVSGAGADTAISCIAVFR